MTVTHRNCLTLRIGVVRFVVVLLDSDDVRPSDSARLAASHLRCGLGFFDARCDGRLDLVSLRQLGFSVGYRVGQGVRQSLQLLALVD